MLLWYVAYGSNLHAARLDWYLRGGRPPGGLRAYPGCRDCRPPRRTVPALIPGGVYFAGESRAWTGGMAFYDPTLPGRAAARGYLVTVEQFADIAAQEMYRPPGADLAGILAAVRTGRATLGPGRGADRHLPGGSAGGRRAVDRGGAAGTRRRRPHRTGGPALRRHSRNRTVGRCCRAVGH
ncbi:hypothetical protein [Micromonospora sp. DT31]|uniref:hypothetical protein n=1 Tax=Micromonospora sp. DT31 TaxID=3393434 RepID=UPI003CF403BA